MTPVEQVKTWLVQGHTPEQIAESIAANYPKQDAETLLSQAYQEFAQLSRQDSEQMRGCAIASTQYCYQKLIELGDYGGAMRAAKQLFEFGESEEQI